MDAHGTMDALAYLPDDVLVAILIRLPARSIARCREVCRAWRSAISHPSFDIAHGERRAAVVKVTMDQCYDYYFDKGYGSLESGTLETLTPSPVFFGSTPVLRVAPAGDARGEP
ncbi:hypothetical protein QYE76_067680 [Lolium multiflorum]|uniref:F-box domain-containing protein n=1 Tax=Lolium multiflorum TaxID=4521 RepID=A0AAD8SFB0_LOLMU|nr:hypothetical protein QYE76_067680 [Lolium multiflorum]